MGTFFKVIMRNIWDKKLRTILIVFSVLLSTMLIFCSMAISGTLENVYTAQVKKQIGTADIIVVEGERTEYKYFSMEPALSFAEETEYIVGGVIGHGYYNGNAGEKTVDLYGVTLEDLQVFNPITYAVMPGDRSFEGNQTVISQPFANEIGASIGDTVSFIVDGTSHSFEIYAISNPVGPFTDGTAALQAVIPIQTYASIVGAQNGDVRVICIKLKDADDIERVIGELTAVYPNNSVREPISQDELNQKVGTLSVSFMVISVIVFLLSAFIILSSFKVIAQERLPVAGTFRSVGATKRMVTRMLMMESILYGVLGGVLGCLGGVGILHVLSGMMSLPGMEQAVTFSLLHIITAFIIAITLTFVASVMPIAKTSNTAIKDIVLNAVPADSRKKPKVSLYLGIAFILLRFIAPQVVSAEMGLLTNVLCLVLTVVGVVLLLPTIMDGGVWILRKVNRLFFGNVGDIAAMNLRRNKNMLNSVTLLAIGVASLLLINVVTSSVLNEMAGVFRNITTFDVYTAPIQGDDKLADGLLSVQGIDDVFSFYTALGVYAPDKNDEISVVEGINPDQYLDYVNIEFEDGINTLRELTDGRNILVSSLIQNKMNLQEGDILTLNMEIGNVDYTVIGFFASTIYGSNYAIVSEQNLKDDMQMDFYSFMYVKSSLNGNEVARQIKQQFPDRFRDVYTIEELIENDSKNNGMVFYLLNAFSVLSMLIGIFGIVNNLIVNFMERKRWIAMMRCVGMSKNQIAQMIFVESLTGGIIGGTAGVLMGLLMILLIPNIMVAMGLVYTLHYSVPLLLLYLLASVLVMVVASVSPAIKSSKLKIIEVVKYE